MSRILFFYSHPFNSSNGGIESVTNNISQTLIQKYGYDIFYMCGYCNEPEQLLFSDVNVKQYSLPCIGFFESKENVDYFITFLKEKEIDVVISQCGAWTYMEPMLKLGDCKYISVIHSVPNIDLIEFNVNYFNHSISFTGYLRHAVKFILYPIYGLYLRNKVIKKMRNHYKYLVNNSDKIIVLSKRYISELESIIGRKSSKITSINNPNPYVIRPVNYSKKEKIILYVGRLESMQKQPIELLKIWKKLFRRFKDWKLMFVGDGESRKTMESFVSANNLERVYFEGKKDNVAIYYEKSSIICLVSRFEGQPMVLTEGMARGCVPICYDSFGAVHDVIDNGVNGYIVPYMNKAAYVEALCHLMSDDNLINNMAQAAEEKVLQFSRERIVKEWDNLISSLIL